MKTQLKDRTLYFDGTNQVKPSIVSQLFMMGVVPEQIVVEEEDDDILLYNSLAELPLSKSKLENNALDFRWKIPSSYMNIDLSAYISEKISYLKSDRLQDYIDRADKELKEIRQRDMELLFKTLIYIVDKLKETNTFWGVGRGSSCASLILYLIGLHKVDPIKYNIPIGEFFHD